MKFQLPKLGFGCAPLGGVFGEIDEEKGIAAVRLALESGLNFFDVAPFYGRTRAETVLGKALQGIPRESYILSTKVGRYDVAEFDFSAGKTRESIKESQERLGVDYFDIVLCHDIEFGSLDMVVEETLPYLYELKRQGLIRAVGASALPLHTLGEVVQRSDLDVILSYCHYTLYDTSLEEFYPLLESRGITLINAAPLAMGLLTEQGPFAWHPASPELKEACRKAAAHCRAHGQDIATLALQFAYHGKGMASTLVGMETIEQVTRNIACVAQPLDLVLLAEVQEILAPVHNSTWASGPN